MTGARWYTPPKPDNPQPEGRTVPESSPNPLVVAVVGATGAVGRTMIQVLLEKQLPISELRLLASARSAGRTVTVAGAEHTVGLATPDAFDGVDIALFSAGGGTSKELAPEAARRGCTVIDNSSAWRMDPEVPLVVSEVNPHAIREAAKGIMANTIHATIRADIGGDHQRIHSADTRYRDVTFKHILLPVWISAYRYHERVFRFLVNARTGEVQGERPYSWVKITLAILAALAVIAILMMIFGRQ